MTMEQTSTAAGTAPTGRAGAPVVVVDALDYAQRVVLQGAEIPWEPASHVRFLGQISALLRPDRTLIDVGRLSDALLAGRPDLAAAMAARSRTGYALRTLLADEQIAGAAVETVRIAAASGVRPIVLQLPSPGVWLSRTAAIAGVDDDADADDRENASVYVADWLRRFAELPVQGIVLDGRGAREPETLAEYGPLRGLAEHYRWELLLRTDTGVDSLLSEAEGVPSAWWKCEDEGRVDADWLIAEIPVDAVAEEVLVRRSALT